MNHQLTKLLVASALLCFPSALQAGLSPAITTQPQSQTTAAGSSVTFTVAATGTAPLGFQWRFNGANLSGATNPTLTLANVQPAQAGSYSVRVSNPYGSAQSGNAQLTVNVPALITNQPMSLATAAGSTVSFDVAASGTAPIYYQWRYNGVPMAGATKSTLTLTNVDIVNSGDYSVIASNMAGADTSITAKLDVTRKIRQSWVARYNGSANGPDTATATAADAQGNVYVTGYAQEQGSGLDYVTLKYNAAGVLLWRAAYNGPAGQDDQATALALDSAGNV
ncbi:MAG TPA: immunoglobulin domain-containing protein, partial [Verrucomicrobiae bacterium]|nr:immunoglobulin domain-containing protein [Verrucomicrobiae bacterium]